MRTILLACLLLMPVLAGCAALGPSPQKGLTLAAGHEGPLNDQDLARLVEKASLVMVGETHHHPGHHQVQLKILKLMSAGGAKPVVGIEWLDSSAQPACDQLSAGRITVKEFARRVEWEKRWGYDLGLYAPILEEVRAQGLTLAALNAPVKVIRKIARQGLSSLDRGEREQIAPSLNLDDPAYRKFVGAQFAGHGVHGKMMKVNFLTAQIARDETMAHRMAARLTPWPDGKKRGVLFCGSGHMAHGLGISPRLKRRLPNLALLTVLPVSLNRLKDQSWPLEAADYPADVLVVTGPEPPRPRGRPRLGLLLKPTEKGLLVERVLPGSAAMKAGLKPGDVLTAMDSKPLRQVMDIHRGLRNEPFKRHNYAIERNGERLTFGIALTKP